MLCPASVVRQQLKCLQRTDLKLLLSNFSIDKIVITGSCIMAYHLPTRMYYVSIWTFYTNGYSTKIKYRDSNELRLSTAGDLPSSPIEANFNINMIFLFYIRILTLVFEFLLMKELSNALCHHLKILLPTGLYQPAHHLDCSLDWIWYGLLFATFIYIIVSRFWLS